MTRFTAIIALLLVFPFQEKDTQTLDFGRFTIVVPSSWTRVNVQGNTVALRS